MLFSRGLGASVALFWGKHNGDEVYLWRVATVSAAGDTLVSILAALFIVPTVMLFGMEMDGGPTLLFQAVPALLAEIPASRLVGSFMLSSLSLVAFLSALAVYPGGD